MTDDVLCVRVSPNGKLLAAALLDSTVRVFFADSLKFFLSLYGHKLPVLSMDISSGGWGCVWGLLSGGWLDGWGAGGAVCCAGGGRAGRAVLAPVLDSLFACMCMQLDRPGAG